MTSIFWDVHFVHREAIQLIPIHYEAHVVWLMKEKFATYEEEICTRSSRECAVFHFELLPTVKFWLSSLHFNTASVNIDPN